MIRNFKTSSLLKSFLRNTQKTLFARSLPATSLFRPNNPSPFLFAPRFSMSTQALHKNVTKSSYEGPGFYMEQLFTGCLAIYSYYIESGSECFLVDPLFDISEYNSLIKSRGKTLKGIFISHYHADYLSGQNELAKIHKCKIYMGPRSIPTETVVTLNDKETIPLGKIKLECWHTPGHTEESSCLALVNA